MRYPAQSSVPTSPSRGESGHLLLIVMIGLVVMSIMLGAAVQQWSTIERRENEKELIFRGNQYVKAIQLYQKEHGGALPTSLEVLIKPGPRRLRYIRKLYRDPMVPDGKWGILLADPSGRGYINPNAPNPTGQEGVPGLEDLGQGFSSNTLEGKLKLSNLRNTSRENAFSAKWGDSSDWTTATRRDEDDNPDSVTAPGQPTGPIVGVVSLADETSFQLYRQHENYSEWAFNIFEDGGANNQLTKQPLSPVATPGAGLGPGAGFSIIGAPGGAVGGTGPGPMPGFKGTHPKQQKPNNPPPR